MSSEREAERMVNFEISWPGKEIHLSKGLKKEREHAMQISGGSVFYAARAASANALRW